MEQDFDLHAELSYHEANSGLILECWSIAEAEIESPPNEHVVLTSVINGKGDYLRDDALGCRTFGFEPGAMALTLPFDKMRAGCDDVEIISLLIPSGHFTRAVADLTGGSVQDAIETFSYGLHEWKFAADFLVNLDNLLQTFPSKREELLDSASSLLIPALLQRMGLAVIEGGAIGTRLTSRQIAALETYVDANLSDRISVSDMARHAGVGPRHLSRLFQSTFGFSPYAWVQDYRLRRARSMLRNGQGNVTSVGFACGFQSPSAFGQKYRERFGVSPSSRLLR
ncbi:MAG: AraC family transcriptional regulator [Pseudomonadota bacterium]